MLHIRQLQLRLLTCFFFQISASAFMLPITNLSIALICCSACWRILSLVNPPEPTAGAFAKRIQTDLSRIGGINVLCLQFVKLFSHSFSHTFKIISSRQHIAVDKQEPVWPSPDTPLHGRAYNASKNHTSISPPVLSRRHQILVSGMTEPPYNCCKFMSALLQ